MHRSEGFEGNPAPSGGNKFRSLLGIFIPAALLLIFVLSCFLGMRQLSLTSDEAKHYRYGQNILAGDSTRFDDSKMPISALNALPAWLAARLPGGLLQTWLQKFLTARLMTVFFSCLVGLAIFSWTREMYGFLPGLASLALYLFDPNILAHSQLVTTDIYAAGTTLFAAYALWRFARSRRLLDGLLCALLLGVSLLAKYTSVVLLPLFALTLFIHDWPSALELGKPATKKDTPAPDQGQGAGATRPLQAPAAFAGVRLAGLFGQVLGYSLAALAVCLLVVNLGFLFNRSFMPLGAYDLQFSTFQKLQRALPAFIPVPTPYPFLQGLDLVSMRDATGLGHGKIYLLGRLSQNNIPGYYFVDYLLKEPLASQILLIAALALYFLRKKYKTFRQKELFLLIPAIFYIIYLNFFYNTQIGIRYYLVIFPLLFVFTGSLLQDWAVWPQLPKASVWLLFAWLLVSSHSYMPFFLSYMNEIVPDRKMAYKYLADSNLDWEQGKLYLDAYLAAHRQADYEPITIKPGQVVVSINHLVGVLGPVNQYAWLRNNFQPVDIIAGEYLVYRLTPQQISDMCARTGACTP